MARELMQARESSILIQEMLLERIRKDGLHRDLGFRNFGDYLASRRIPRSTGYGKASRDRLLDTHPALRRAVVEGRLTRSKADALQPVLGSADVDAWVAYAQERTCRRVALAASLCVQISVEAPLAWARRGKRPPQEGETLEDLMREAGVSRLEQRVEELHRLLETAQSPPPVQTFSSTDSPEDAPAPKEVQTISSTSPSIRLRIHYPSSMKDLVRLAHETACRAAGRELTPEESFHRPVLFFLATEGVQKAVSRGDKLRALERAGWRCEAPGCRGRCNLEVHHVVYRSRGGRDELSNYVVLCAAHHQRHLHAGRMKVEGDEPATRIWDMGIHAGEAYRTYVDERLVDAWEWDRQDERPDRVSEHVVPYRVDVTLPRAA